MVPHELTDRLVGQACAKRYLRCSWQHKLSLRIATFWSSSRMHTTTEANLLWRSWESALTFLRFFFLISVVGDGDGTPFLSKKVNNKNHM